MSHGTPAFPMLVPVIQSLVSLIVLFSYLLKLSEPLASSAFTPV